MAGGDDAKKAAWVARVLGVDIGGGLDPQALSSRLAALTGKVDEATAPSGVMDDLRAADAALKGNDPGLAAGLLDEVEGRLASADRAGAAAAEIAKGRVSDKVGVADFAKLQLSWNAARSARAAAIDAMRALSEAVLADPDVQEDEEFGEIEAAVASAGDFMPELPEEIDDFIDDMRSATDEGEREAARKQALAAIKTFRAELDGAEELKLMEQLPYGTYDIYGRVAKALAGLEDALKR